jgi:hypothetical protein
LVAFYWNAGYLVIGPFPYFCGSNFGDITYRTEVTTTLTQGETSYF